MGIYFVSYWIWVVVCLYATYLVCCCLYKVDAEGNKTDERIYVPRIVYLAMAAISFAPVANIIVGAVVVGLSIVMYYVNEDFYVKTWLLDKPNQKEKQKGKE